MSDSSIQFRTIIAIVQSVVGIALAAVTLGFIVRNLVNGKGRGWAFVAAYPVLSIFNRLVWSVMPRLISHSPDLYLIVMPIIGLIIDGLAWTSLLVGVILLGNDRNRPPPLPASHL